MEKSCVIVGINRAKKTAWVLSKALNKQYFVYKLKKGTFLVTEIENQGLKLVYKIKSRVAVDVD